MWYYVLLRVYLFMEIVLLANGLNAVAGVLSLSAHAMLSMGSKDKIAHWMYFISCIGFVIGSSMLESWPVVWLNVIWGGLSWMSIKEKKLFGEHSTRYLVYLTYPIFLVGLGFLLLGEYDLAAYMTTGLYVIAYALICSKEIAKLSYLIWCSLGFLLLVPHLLQHLQYSVMAAEGIGFLIGVIAIAKIAIKREQSRHLREKMEY